jgi:hypothetical protein
MVEALKIIGRPTDGLQASMLVLSGGGTYGAVMLREEEFIVVRKGNYFGGELGVEMARWRLVKSICSP